MTHPHAAAAARMTWAEDEISFEPETTQKTADFLHAILKGDTFPPTGYDDTPTNSRLWHHVAQKTANLQAEGVTPTPGLVTPEE
jgi:hypothetical protein